MKSYAFVMFMAWVASPAWAASDARYFFTAAQTDTDDPAVTGAYDTPQCAVMSQTDYDAIRANCTKWDNATEQCDTKKTVHVKILENEQYDFPLVHYVFKNLPACQKARAEMTTNPE